MFVAGSTERHLSHHDRNISTTCICRGPYRYNAIVLCIDHDVLILLQLMQYVTSPPVLTCEPTRLIEEFPQWLERVSSRLPGGIILVIDSLDKLQVSTAKQCFFILGVKCFCV